MTDLRQCETHRIGYWHPDGCPMCKTDADQGAIARALLDARAELAQARADAQAAVADIVRSVWGCCEALEDEAADKLAQLEKLTDHEKGFWRGQKTVAKSIRRSTEMPTAEAIAIRRAEGGKA